MFVEVELTAGCMFVCWWVRVSRHTQMKQIQAGFNRSSHVQLMMLIGSLKR